MEFFSIASTLGFKSLIHDLKSLNYRPVYTLWPLVHVGYLVQGSYTLWPLVHVGYLVQGSYTLWPLVHVGYLVQGSSSDDESSSCFLFFTRFLGSLWSQLLVQCLSDWQMKQEPNGGLNTPFATRNFSNFK